MKNQVNCISFQARLLIGKSSFFNWKIITDLFETEKMGVSMDTYNIILFSMAKPDEFAQSSTCSIDLKNESFLDNIFHFHFSNHLQLQEPT